MAARWVLLAIVLQAAAAASEPTTELDGLPIVRIVVDRYNIFDTTQKETSKWPYRAANSLHIVSRESFIRKMLLFSEGDPYSAELAAESARMLRELGFMEPVYITASPAEDGVEVTVETHDRWTLHVSLDFSLQGNRSRFGLSFKEENFLGRGLELRAGYTSDEERDRLNFSFLDPNFLGSRWRIFLLYSDTSDGYERQATVERPFFSLSTPHSWGGEWLNWQLNEYLYSDAEQVVTGRVARRGARLWWGLRLPSSKRVIRRLTTGIDWRDEVFSDWRWIEDGRPYLPPEDRRISGPRISYRQIANRYLVLQGFRGWKVQEDVGLGLNLWAGMTISLPAFGGDRPRLPLDGRASLVGRKGGWLLLGDLIGEARIEDGGLNNGVLGLQIGAAQLGNRGWQLRFRTDVSRNLDSDRQLTLGADIGLRGWSPDTFDGTARALVNIQWRRLLLEDLFHVASLGMVVFADAGRTWRPRVGRGTDGIRTNLGVGVLADLSRIGISSLARVEVAVPDDGSGLTVTLTSSSLF
jgi:hypothetical protein